MTQPQQPPQEKPEYPGRFIAFEGGEGAGKTRHSRRLYQQLTAAGRSVLLVREPGGTGLGEHLRSYLKSDRPLHPRAELLLFGAARAQLAAELILPALREGRIVIADRYAASTLAYQGGGRGLPTAFIRRMNDYATQGCYPDLNILLDLPPELGLSRSNEQQAGFIIDLREQAAPLGRNATGRRFDDLPLELHRRIRQEFLAMAQVRQPQTWAVIDAAREFQETAAAVWAAVQPIVNPTAEPMPAPLPWPEQFQQSIS